MSQVMSLFFYHNDGMLLHIMGVRSASSFSYLDMVLYSVITLYLFIHNYGCYSILGYFPCCIECQCRLAMKKVSVHLSVKHVDCDKMEERSVQLFIPQATMGLALHLLLGKLMSVRQRLSSDSAIRERKYVVQWIPDTSCGVSDNSVCKHFGSCPCTCRNNLINRYTLPWTLITEGLR